MSKEAMKLAASVLKGSQEYKRGHTTFVEAVEELEEALAEQPAQQESQSMALNAAMGYIMRHTPKLVHDEICKALRRPVMGASPRPAQQEPVAKIEITRCKFTGELESWTFAERPRNAPAGTYYVYTSPPAQRTWVGLSDKEIADAATSHPLTWVNLNAVEHRQYFARAIEAAHNIKEQS